MGRSPETRGGHTALSYGPICGQNQVTVNEATQRGEKEMLQPRWSLIAATVALHDPTIVRAPRPRQTWRTIPMPR